MKFTRAMALRAAGAILVCVILAEVAVAVTYSFVAPERLVFELLLAIPISLAVATPVIIYFVLLTEQLKAARLDAASSDRAKSVFLATMSHEIRTPLNGVLGVAELLDHTRLDERQKQLVGVVKSSGDALLAIIDEVLDLSKIEAGRMELNVARFSPRALVEDVAMLIAARVADRPVEIIARIGPAVPLSLEGDAGRLRQIIVNLAGNAAKFTEVGHVLIEASGEPCGGGFLLRLSVEDTGPGIPLKDRERIFEAFRQGEDSLSRRRQGVGLGLSISASLTRLMNGRIHVGDGRLGGARFSVEAALPIPPDGAGKSAPALAGLPVLLLSASSLVGPFLQEALAAEGAEVRLCEDVASALAACGSRPVPGVVLYDWRGESAAQTDALRAGAAFAGAGFVMLAPLGGGAPGNGDASEISRPARGDTLMRALIAARCGRAVGPFRKAMGA